MTPPAEQTDVDVHRRSRIRGVGFSAIASAGQQVVTVAVSLLSVPLALGYLGTERFGIWMTITSFLALMRFADLGIGNGLVNLLSDAIGRDDWDAAVGYTSAAFFGLTGIGLFALLGFGIAYPLVDWKQVVNTQDPVAAAEVGPTFIVLATCVAVNIPASVVQRVQAAQQKAYRSSVYVIIGGVLGLAGVLACAKIEAPLPWLVISVTGGALLGTVANGVHEFWLRTPHLRPRFGRVKWINVRRLLGVGVLFLIIQLTGSLLVSADNILLAHILGPASVTAYAVPNRLFIVGPMLLGILLAPLWAAYSEARARGDADWIRKTFFQSIRAALLVSVLTSAGTALLAPWLLRIWVGNALAPPEAILLLGFASWGVVLGVSCAYAVFLNGMNAMRFQAFFAGVVSVVAITLKITLAKTIGVSGMVWGMVLAQGIFGLIPAIWLARRRLQEPATV